MTSTWINPVTKIFCIMSCPLSFFLTHPHERHRSLSRCIALACWPNRARSVQSCRFSSAVPSCTSTGAHILGRSAPWRGRRAAPLFPVEWKPRVSARSSSSRKVHGSRYLTTEKEREKKCTLLNKYYLIYGNFEYMKFNLFQIQIRIWSQFRSSSANFDSND